MSPYESIRNKVHLHTRDLQGKRLKNVNLFFFSFILFCAAVFSQCLADVLTVLI